MARLKLDVLKTTSLHGAVAVCLFGMVGVPGVLALRAARCGATVATMLPALGLIRAGQPSYHAVIPSDLPSVIGMYGHVLWLGSAFVMAVLTRRVVFLKTRLHWIQEAASWS